MKPKPTSQATRRAIVITGTPGTGKTTVSRALAEQIDAKCLFLTRVVIAKRLYSTIDNQRQTRVIDMERTRSYAVEVLSKAQAMMVVDTHVPDAIPRKYVRGVIVLRCHPNVLERRLRKKGWSARKIRENVLAEILDSCYVTALGYYGAKKIAEIDTSRANARTCASQVKRIIYNHKSGMRGIDWISTLKREHSLEKYLST